MASLDRDPSEPPAAHVNVESKAPWFEILDDRPQYPAFPSQAEMEAAIRRVVP